MWLKTTDGDLVNTDQLVRIGRMGGDGEVVLYAMGDTLTAIGALDEATWLKLLAEWEIPALQENDHPLRGSGVMANHMRKKPLAVMGKKP